MFLCPGLQSAQTGDGLPTVPGSIQATIGGMIPLRKEEREEVYLKVHPIPIKKFW